MIPLGTTSRFENDTSSLDAELVDPFQFLFLRPLFDLVLIAVFDVVNVLLEPAFALTVPDHKACHRVFVGAGPAIVQEDAWKGVAPWGIAVESLILRQEIVFGDEAGVEVAIRQVDRCDTVVMDVHFPFTAGCSKGVTEDE